MIRFTTFTTVSLICLWVVTSRSPEAIPRWSLSNHDRLAQSPLIAPGSSQSAPPPGRLDGDFTHILPAESSDGSLSMRLYSLHVSGNWSERVDLTFFSDGYTTSDEAQFISDAQRLSNDIISPGGAMSNVAHLLNVYAVFVPSVHSGIGAHGSPLPGASFGLYRPESELRAVFATHYNRARRACGYWRDQGRQGGKGGCDQPILLGNDPLYGGLGGEFTIITASKLNGPLVLRHELGHSLIDVGEEYEGGYAYFGVNSESLDNLDSLKWADMLSNVEQENGGDGDHEHEHEPDHEQQLRPKRKQRVEDAYLALQAYPWHNLSLSSWQTTFPLPSNKHAYPTALLRLSLSSIPYPSHINITLNGRSLDIDAAFPKDEWAGSKDRRWVEIPLDSSNLWALSRVISNPNEDKEGGIEKEEFIPTLTSASGVIQVSLTPLGEAEQAGQGGKMLSSIEIVLYGTPDRFNATPGHIAAYPTWSIDGTTTVRPTNEGCLMRRVNHPSFCAVCERGLNAALLARIAEKEKQ